MYVFAETINVPYLERNICIDPEIYFRKIITSKNGLCNRIYDS